MIGRTATYQGNEVRIVGYIEWGAPTKIMRYWIVFDDDETEELVSSKYVKIHK